MVGVIIQARLGSQRLPGKVLKPIGNKCLLDHIMCRLRRLRTKAQIIVATSVEKTDDVLALYCRDKGYTCYRGSEGNVLERYYMCTQKYGFDDIVRLTGDNPFVDVEELDRLIEYYKECGVDYAKSFEALPEGVGAEIFSYAALEKDYREASMQHHFEHVNEYILENPQLFKIVDLAVTTEKNRPDVRLTVDTEEDYYRACYIVRHCTDEYVTTQAAVRLAIEYEGKKSE